MNEDMEQRIRDLEARVRYLTRWVESVDEEADPTPAPERPALRLVAGGAR